MNQPILSDRWTRSRTKAPRGRVLALYRKPSYSPNQHRVNDTAIMDAVVSELLHLGWSVERALETQVETGDIGAAEVYLNMCQGPLALARLQELELDGAIMINRASSALACHRHRLVRRLADSGLDFPRTVIVPTAITRETEAALGSLAQGASALWVKRGDVHAERPEDVLRVGPDAVRSTLRDFAARGIDTVAVQAHVPGPVVKFYAVAGSRFFRYYGADEGPSGTPPLLEESRLQELAFAAAERLGLRIFGGDVAVPDPSRPVLIDINDWPSFAPFRTDAARAIGALVHQHARIGATT